MIYGEDHENILEKNKSHSQKSIKDIVFLMFSKIYFESKPKKKSNLYQRSKIILQSTVFCLQMMSLL